MSALFTQYNVSATCLRKKLAYFLAYSSEMYFFVKCIKLILSLDIIANDGISPLYIF